MDLDFSETRRRHVGQLQLASMIDIFTLIIVFLMKGTVLGGVSINFPANFLAPQSSSTEALEAAPQVVIFEDEVEMNMIHEKFPMKIFTVGNEAQERVVNAKLVKYLKDLAPENKLAMSQVNVLADAKAPYENVFAVVRFLREAGYTSMLFIAHGEGRK